MRKLVVVSFVLALLSIASLMTSCGGEDPIHSSGHTQFFTQDFNPEYLDILWVLDDRSPLNAAKDQIVDQAKKFFLKLDDFAGSYRMGVINACGTGALLDGGDSKPLILEKKQGTPDERAAIIESRIRNTINLRTCGEISAMKSVRVALSDAAKFPVRPGVPLVIVFISDSYDEDGKTADLAKTYAADLKSIKGNADHLRAYSINLVALDAADDINTTPKRCTFSRHSADIDTQVGVKNPFEEFVALVGGENGDLCGGFSSQISLSGLVLKKLQTTFMLESIPDIPSSITVILTHKGQELPTTPWHYDAATNSIVFESLPTEGATIQVTYR